MPPVPRSSYPSVCRESKSTVMGRSWRNFFKRSEEEPEERSGAAVDTLEQETGIGKGTPPPADTEAKDALEPVDESVIVPKSEPVASVQDLEVEAAEEVV